MPRLVDHLRAAIQFGIDPGDRGRELTGDKDRQLLAMQELAQVPGEGLVPQGCALRRRHLAPDRRVLYQRYMRVFMVEEDFSFRVHRRAPVYVDRDVPLLALGFFVEITEPLMRDVIVPG